MLERPGLNILRGRSLRIIDHRVADVAVIRNDLACLANMLPVMTAETALRIKVSGVVRMGLPIGPHLGKEIILKYALQFLNRLFDHILSLCKDIVVIGTIKLGNV